MARAHDKSVLVDPRRAASSARWPDRLEKPRQDVRSDRLSQVDCDSMRHRCLRRSYETGEDMDQWEIRKLYRQLLPLPRSYGGSWLAASPRLYGSPRRAFFGESMFHRKTTLKVSRAFAARLAKGGFRSRQQFVTPHLASLARLKCRRSVSAPPRGCESITAFWSWRKTSVSWTERSPLCQVQG